MPFSSLGEIREKAVNAYLEGKGTREKIADIFGINVSTLRHYLIRYENDNDVVPKPHPGRPLILGEEDLQWIKSQVEAKADTELEELCDLLSH